MKLREGRIAAAVATLLLLVQFWPAGRTNPPVTSDLRASSEIDSILRRCCYDCHSNETIWPWYGYVAPFSFLLVDDVRKGRAKLNFSTWGEYKAPRRSGFAEEIVEQVGQGAMPLKKYLWLHPSRKVSSAELDALRRWAAGQP